jgi:hypothetical protein
MFRCPPAAALIAAVLLCGGALASADTLRCQSVNGNLNCSGSGGISCQSVDGRKVCVSGHGGVVQSFGNGSGHDARAGDPPPDNKKLPRYPGLGTEPNGMTLRAQPHWLPGDDE